MKATHPKCGKSFSGAQSVGHCASCCETFVGLGAFDKHMNRDADGKYHHRDPIEAEKWWLDDRGYWHHGPKLTDEQKAKMWPKEEDE